MLILSGCQNNSTGGQSGEVPVETLPSYENQKIALIVSTLMNPFFVDLKDGAMQQAETYGLNLIVLDSRDDPERERDNFEKLIHEEVDVILLNATDSTASVGLIDMAVQEGILVATIDRNVDTEMVSLHITSDNYAGGQLAGHYIAEQLAGTGNVIELLGIGGTSVDAERGEGFRSVIETTEINIIGETRADFDREKGQVMMSNFLDEFDQISAVFAHNDEMALGALKAITLVGRDIIVVGFDGVDDAIVAIQDGSMAATVSQQPIEIGRVGIRAAAKLVYGEEVEHEILVPLKLITRLVD